MAAVFTDRTYYRIRSNIALLLTAETSFTVVVIAIGDCHSIGWTVVPSYTGNTAQRFSISAGLTWNWDFASFWTEISRITVKLAKLVTVGVFRTGRASSRVGGETSRLTSFNLSIDADHPRHTVFLESITDLIISCLNLDTESRCQFSVSIRRTEFRRNETTSCTVHRCITLGFTSDIITIITLITRD